MEDRDYAQILLPTFRWDGPLCLLIPRQAISAFDVLVGIVRPLPADDYVTTCQRMVLKVIIGLRANDLTIAHVLSTYTVKLALSLISLSSIFRCIAVS